jgi:hypothetical protein
VKAPDGAPKLPIPIRNASVACLVLSALVGFFAAGEGLSLVGLSDIQPGTVRFAGGLDAETVRKAQESQLLALSGMRIPRALTLGALTIACTLNFASSRRLLRPKGIRRESMRELVVGSAIAVALLRTIDGAEVLVVARRVAATLGQLANIPLTSGLSQAEIQRALNSMASAIVIGQTALVVGAYVFLAQYLRSQKVKQRIAAEDQQP